MSLNSIPGHASKGVVGKKSHNGGRWSRGVVKAVSIGKVVWGSTASGDVRIGFPISNGVAKGQDSVDLEDLPIIYLEERAEQQPRGKISKISGEKPRSQQIEI